ncbi:hypothetical protein BRADI_3g32459v3, partial [Brachypodium distachyon]
ADTREEEEMNSCRAAPASPTEDEDLLTEILLRLPARPSSLPRASLVCKSWRRLVTDPQFVRRFWAKHREAPIVGLFVQQNLDEFTFMSIWERPDVIPPERFSLRVDGIQGGVWSFRGCRHGRVVFTNHERIGYGVREVLVWDPVTGDRRCLGLPCHPGHDWSKSHVQAEVHCVARDKGHVHGACHWSPFKVVLACADKGVARACDTPSHLVGSRSILVGNILYWFLFGARIGILELDLDSQNLAVIDMPPDADALQGDLLLSTLGGGLGFITVLGDDLQLWVRMTDSDGVAGWMPGHTIDPYELLALKSGEWIKRVMGIAADVNVMVVSTRIGVFMVHLESLQFEKIFESNTFPDLPPTIYTYPFTSFCAAGNSICS